MSWKDQVTNAGSFRDAEFCISGSDKTGGRNNAVHEFPQEQLPVIQPLSPKPKRFRVDCYVLGKEYISKRDTLINALDEPGKGVLVHPYYGRLEVYVDGEYTVRERPSEGGKATFSIPFILATKIEDLQVSENADDNLDASSAAAHQAAVDAFAEDFKVAGQPSWVAQAAQDVVNKTLGIISDVIRPIAKAQAVVATLQAQVEAIQGSVESLIYAPKELAGQIVGLFDSMADSTDTPEKAIDSYAAFFAPVPTLPSGPQSVVQSRIDANDAAMDTLMKQAAVASTAKTAPSISFTNQNQANNLVDKVDARSDEIILATVHDDVVDRFQQLRADLSVYIRSVTPGLARLVTYTVPATTNSLSLGFDLYGDIDRAEEIVNLNNLIDPAMITGGTVLQVLNV